MNWNKDYQPLFKIVVVLIGGAIIVGQVIAAIRYDAGDIAKNTEAIQVNTLAIQELRINAATNSLEHKHILEKLNEMHEDVHSLVGK